MTLVGQIKDVTAKAIEAVYKVPSYSDDIVASGTKPEFEGDYTVVLFALVKNLRRSPEVLGKELGEYLTNENKSLFTAYNAIFLTIKNALF